MAISGSITRVTYEFSKAILPKNKNTKRSRVSKLKELGIDGEICIYCGDKSAGFDHLNPLVRSKQPTGFLDDENNTVPACTPCNSSKGGKDWREWMSAKGKKETDPSVIGGHNLRLDQIERFALKSDPKQLDFKLIVGEEIWASYWKRRDDIALLLKEADEHAKQIRKKIEDHLSPISK